MERATPPTTSWYVIETWCAGQARHRHGYTVAPRAARVLRQVAAPYLATHRIVGLRRQRARADLSHVRLTLAPRGDGSTIDLAAMMIREERHAA